MSSPSGSLLLQDFSGGLNNRDTPNELAYNETPSADNFTLDQRGGLRIRNGCTDTAKALPGVTNTEAFLFYSKALDLWLCARETSGAPNTMKLHTRPGDLSGSWTDRGTINSDVAANVAFADFAGGSSFVVISTDLRTGATKGTWVYSTGGGLAQPTNANNVSGQSVEVWQNRAWVVGYPTSDANGNPTRAFFSALGDVSSGTAWVPSTNFNDIKDINGDGLTACAVVGGTLHIFKERSAYRVNDSNTGAYITLDTQAGCVGGRAVCKAPGRLYTAGADGMYEWSGGPARYISGKIQNTPIFSSAGSPTNICAVFFDQRIYFAVPGYTTGGSGGVMNNEMIWEYDPSEKWWMRHVVGTNLPAAARITAFAKKNSQLYSAVKNKDTMYSMFDATPGKDASSVSFAPAQYTTRWLQPNSGMLSRLHRLRVMGVADAALAGASGFSVLLQRNWIPTSYISFDITSSIKQQGLSEDNLTVDLQSLGHGTAFQIVFQYASSAAASLSIRGIQLIDQSLAWPSPGYPHRPGITAYHRIPGGPTPSPSGGGGGHIG